MQHPYRLYSLLPPLKNNRSHIKIKNFLHNICINIELIKILNKLRSFIKTKLNSLKNQLSILFWSLLFFLLLLIVYWCSHDCSLLTTSSLLLVWLEVWLGLFVLWLRTGYLLALVLLLVVLLLDYFFRTSALFWLIARYLFRLIPHSQYVAFLLGLFRLLFFALWRFLFLLFLLLLLLIVYFGYYLLFHSTWPCPIVQDLW